MIALGMAQNKLIKNRKNMAKAKRLGDLQEVTNKNPHPAAATKYNFIRVQTEGGGEVELLFTDGEIKRAALRAIKNPEDLPKVSRVRDFLD